LDEDADAVAAGRGHGLAQRVGDPAQPDGGAVAAVRARVDDQQPDAQRLAALQLGDEGGARPGPERRVAGRQVDEVAVVREQRQAAPRRLGRELADLARIARRRRPVAAALREDLHRLAALRIGTIPRAVEAPGRRDLRAQLHGGTIAHLYD